MKVLHIYPETCEYAYPDFPKDLLITDAFDTEIIANTDLEVRYLAGLTHLGEECVFFYPRLFNLPIKEFIHSRNYRMIRFPVSFSIGSVPYPLKMLKYIRKEKPDLIHYHGIYGGGKYFYLRFFNFVTLYSRILRIPVYGWYHTGSLAPIPKIKMFSDKFYLIRKLDHFLRTWVFNHCRGLTSINHPELDRLFNENSPEYYGFKIRTKYKHVTPNTFDKDRFYPVLREEARKILKLDSSKRYMLMVTRLFESKGLHDILSIIPEITEIFPDFHLLVIGDYIERSRAYKLHIDQLIKDLNISKFVTFLGRIEHHQGLNYYFSAAEAHILPTYKESFGAVNLEAMACKIPIITTNIEEMPYYVKKGLGIMINPGNKAELKEAVLKILNKNFKWDEQQYNALIEEYEYRNAAENLLSWYKSTMNK